MTKLLILVGVLDKLAGLWSEHAEASTSRGEGMTAAECDMNFMSVGWFLSLRRVFAATNQGINPKTLNPRP